VNPLVRRLPALWVFLWFAAGAAAWLSTDSSPDLPRVLAVPSWSHPLGCDAFGRDLVLAVLRSAAVSSMFSLLAVAGSISLALGFGVSLALAAPRVAALGSSVLAALLATPSLLLALAWAAVRGPGWGTLAGSLVIGMVPGFTRLIQVRARELRLEDYVVAAWACGATPVRIGARHLLPGLLSLCAVKTPNLFAQALLAEATLSFLGVGAPIGSESWGSLLAQGQDYLIEAPHIALSAGVPLVLTVLSLQALAARLAARRNNDVL